MIKFQSIGGLSFLLNEGRPSNQCKAVQFTLHQGMLEFPSIVYVNRAQTLRAKLCENTMVHFPCDECQTPHVFIIKTLSAPKKLKLPSRPMFGYFNSEMPKVALDESTKSEEFTNQHRETLKRTLLQFGLGRMEQMPEAIAKLTLAPHIQAFVSLLHNNLPTELTEVK